MRNMWTPEYKCLDFKKELSPSVGVYTDSYVVQGLPVCWCWINNSTTPFCPLSECPALTLLIRSGRKARSFLPHVVITFPMAFSQKAWAASLALVQVGNYLASCSNSLVVSVVGESLLHSHMIGCRCWKVSFWKSVTFCPAAWLAFRGKRGCLRTTWLDLYLLRKVENWE